MTKQTDRESLELAAKAAGIEYLKGCHDPELGLNIGVEMDADSEWWNPLTDDGDEARLEAALQMHVEWHPLTKTVTVGRADVACTEPYGADRQAARKRAGVQAAAAIGEQK